jgi:hypothetical protein
MTWRAVDQIIHGGSLNRLDHHRRQHTRIEPHLGQLVQTLLIDSHERNVIGIVGTLFGQSIGRHLDYLAANDRRDALLVARAKQSVGCGTEPPATRYRREIGVLRKTAPAPTAPGWRLSSQAAATALSEGSS